MGIYDQLVRRLQIRTKGAGIASLEPNWAQQEFLDEVERQIADEQPVRIAVLKARQLGMSTITEAVLFVKSFIDHHTHSLVVAHENDASEYLFGMTHLYWETFPYSRLFTPRYVSRRELSWRETGSSIRIATARNARAGRGRTIHSLHASEVGFWDRTEEIMLGMRQTIPNRPGTMIVLESTANGVGNWFYDTWKAAEAGDVEFVPLFFPWWRHPEYSGSYMGLFKPLGLRDEEERALSALGVDDDHLVWRRWAIRNLADANDEKFRQEYPATPDEAFISSGTNLFPIHKLAEVYEPMEGSRGMLFRDGENVRFTADISGPLRIFRMPSKDRDWGRYFVGADPTHTTRGDNACAQIINRRTFEQVAVWVGKCDPFTFAEELAKIGTFYNSATISTEIEGPGYGTIGRLIELDYPYLWQGRWADKSPGKIADSYGWSTTQKRKEWAIGHLIKLMHDKDLLLHDRRTHDEMRNFVTLPTGAYGPANEKTGGHDDTVMALAIAAICSATEGPLMAYSADDPMTERYLEPIIASAPWENWGT